MAVNKVIVKGETKLDLTGDTIAPEHLAEGITAHDKAGNPIVGSAKVGGVAITVVGGTEQPTDVEDNTIWVNTDIDIGMVYLALNAPASPEVGDVWVNTTNKYNSNGTNASTNLIMVNDNPYLEINVLNISQWDGSAWVTRDGSAIYANGAWSSMALYIFNYGTQNEAAPLRGLYGKSSSPSTELIGYGDDYVETVTQGNYRPYCSLQTTALIDVTNYNKITVEHAVWTWTGTTGARESIIGLGTVLNIGEDWSKLYSALRVNTSFSASSTAVFKTTVADISGITGKYAVGVLGWTNSDQHTALRIKYWCLTA